ncbi:MAG: hydrogenase expression/formation protein [gamma proteobacterium endosymbiont of Lamellibrachia anaximandri]|nr:hydrogenase expression/formation protein [gamma proteobacterium endosymbiont of Lamellibrachia anaximandri]MBL3532544.1 hydrogenase expression/formation protein [gamma proteobacterium endosymbiont of Lamellibrachia anaximandri]
MQKLQDIDVRIEAAVDQSVQHGNAIPLLHEILHALRRLGETEEPTTIDLRSIPFGPGDEEQLLDALDRGEVTVKLETLGASEIYETAFAGVWIVEHKNTEGERIALQIEITRVPEILFTQVADLTDSISRLENRLRAPDVGAPAEQSYQWEKA